LLLSLLLMSLLGGKNDAAEACSCASRKTAKEESSRPGAAATAGRGAGWAGQYTIRVTSS
jgi:hypothetical protein